MQPPWRNIGCGPYTGRDLPCDGKAYQAGFLFYPEEERIRFTVSRLPCELPITPESGGAVSRVWLFEVANDLASRRAEVPPSPGPQRRIGLSLTHSGYLYELYGRPYSDVTQRLAAVRAFSIDDAATTEIDDAFSITPTDAGWRVGIHIAAPGIGFGRESALDTIARERLSTVYMPGNKITMLPEDIVSRFTLGEGRDCPALSLYLEVSRDLIVTGHSSRVERVPVVANLRHHDIEPVFNETTLSEGGPDFPWKAELTLLWELATVLEAGRGKPSANQNQVDFNFSVDWSQTTADGPGRIEIGRRSRGSPLDKLVAELMIAANSTWGKALAEAGIPALYRAQTGGKVRMTTAAAPHEGLGVDCYAWSSSPLRRYVDLVNQWQLIAWVKGEAPAFPPKSPDLLAAMRDFELTYAAYAEFQRGMERYWCLRWLRQAGHPAMSARVLRESLVRLEAIPLIFKVPSMPTLPPGTRVQLAIDGTDLVDVEVRATYLETLAEASGEATEELDEADLPPEALDAASPPDASTDTAPPAAA